MGKKYRQQNIDQGVRIFMDQQRYRPKKGKEKSVYGYIITKSNKETKRIEVKEGHGEKAKEVQRKPGTTIGNKQHRNNI